MGERLSRIRDFRLENYGFVVQPFMVDAITNHLPLTSAFIPVARNGGSSPTG